MDEATTTRYLQLPDGRLRQVVLSEGVSTPTPEGAVELTEEAFRAGIAVLEAERAAQEEAQQVAELALSETAYLALRAVGLPQAVASRLSGHEPLVDLD
jgi:hypothetical protein